MRIKYKEPYWVKFSWDLSNHHDDQYVTKFDKNDNMSFFEFQHEKKFIINCEFAIPEGAKSDYFSMIYGKPGKNMGLTYCADKKTMSFEFWTTKKMDNDLFHYIPIKNIDQEQLQNGIVITIIRDENEIKTFINYKENVNEKFDEDLIDDYRWTGLFMGCSNPGAAVTEHRYYGEVEMKYFTILKDISDIEIAKELHQTESEKIITKHYYKNILCLYDFKLSNNLGIFYDESKYNNFLEKVPNKFLLK